MQTTTLPNGLVKLSADDGSLIVYQGDPATAAPTVYLGKGDSPANYSEMPAAEVAEWRSEQEAMQARAEAGADSDPAGLTDNTDNAEG